MSATQHPSSPSKDPGGPGAVLLSISRILQAIAIASIGFAVLLLLTGFLPEGVRAWVGQYWPALHPDPVRGGHMGVGLLFIMALAFGMATAVLGILTKLVGHRLPGGNQEGEE